MSGRASNQVNNLRAIFEQNNKANSPPTRDRSSAGPDVVKGNESRPVAKVRTSFIAVERSGPMAPAVGLQKVNGEEQNKSEQNEGRESSAVVDGMVDGSPKVNGDNAAQASKEAIDKPDEGKGAVQTQPAETSSPDHSQTTLEKKVERTQDGSPAQAEPEKDAERTQDDLPAQTEPEKPHNSDPSEHVDKSETSKPAGESQGLGDILKGAPFENELPASSETSGAHATGVPESESSPSKQNADSKTSLPNGQPKKRLGLKTSLPPTAQSGSSRPPAIDTQKGSP